jgi:hypothetical protein
MIGDLWVLMGSNTRFGLVLFAACALISGWGWKGSTAWLVAAALLLAITVTIPCVPGALKKGWMRIGGLLHVVVSPVGIVHDVPRSVTGDGSFPAMGTGLTGCLSLIRRRGELREH